MTIKKIITFLITIILSVIAVYLDGIVLLLRVFIYVPNKLIKCFDSFSAKLEKTILKYL